MSVIIARIANLSGEKKLVTYKVARGVFGLVG